MNAIDLWRRVLCVSAASAALLLAIPSVAAIIGKLESPKEYASQISNVQGWIYTTNPGAELIQPFDVSINGVKIQEVPCCSDRGDVQEQEPRAPLATGFSGVVNWAREAIHAEGPTVVTVAVRDTSGDSVTLRAVVDLVALTSFPFSRTVEFAEPETFASGFGSGQWVSSRCALENVSSGDGNSAAQMTCTNLLATKIGGDQTELCDGQVRYTWERSVQGFRQSSFCEPLPRWDEHGDGTATDNTTGLMWELKTGEAAGNTAKCGVDGPRADSCVDLHHVQNGYTWSTIIGLRNGTAFTHFLGVLNSGIEQRDGTIAGCFAGYCDWRLPTLEELTTLEPCAECDPIPGETAPNPTWSTTRNAGPNVWAIYGAGDASIFKPFNYNHVRAVRGESGKQRVLPPT